MQTPSRKHLKNPAVKERTASTATVRFGPITIKVEWDDEAQSYASFSPDINVASGGYSVDQAIEKFKEALAGHLQVSREYGKRLGIAATKARQLEKLLLA